jgi:hypothetical protein
MNFPFYFLLNTQNLHDISAEKPTDVQSLPFARRTGPIFLLHSLVTFALSVSFARFVLTVLARRFTDIVRLLQFTSPSAYLSSPADLSLEIHCLLLLRRLMFH